MRTTYCLILQNFLVTSSSTVTSHLPLCFSRGGFSLRQVLTPPPGSYSVAAGSSRLPPTTDVNSASSFAI